MRIPILLLSHVAFGLVGWWMAREFQASSAPKPAENARTRSTRQRPLDPPGAELLRSIETRLEKEKSEKARLAAEPGAREKILGALTGLALPADPAAAIHALLEVDDETASIRAAAHFVLWAKSDPDAALQFASDRERFNRMSCGDESLELVGEFIVPEMVLSMPEDNRRDPLLCGLARQLIANRTVDQILTLMSGSNDELKSDLAFQLGYQWPAERLDEYGRLATAMNDPEMLRHARWCLPIEEMTNWLMRFADEHPDKEFARRIRETDLYLGLLSFQPAIPLDKRLEAVMKNFSSRRPPTESAREEAMEFLAYRDVSGFFDDDGPDFHHAFHHGKIEASELLARLTFRFPEHAAAGLIPALLYQELAPYDPDRAASLMADLPAVDRARVIAETGWLFCSLDTISRVLDQFPDSDHKEVNLHRKAFWEEHVDYCIEEYGEVYLRWILSLPDPLDRRLALGVIADEIDNNNNDEHVAELREIVGDIPLRDPP